MLAPDGFINTGSICYWNALMQCMLSSKEISNELSSGEAIDNPFDLKDAYLKLIKESQPRQSGVVLNILINILRKKNINLIYGDQQESASEGLVHFIGQMPKLEYLLSHRYEKYVICGNCNFKSAEVRDTAIHFECFDKDFENITTPEEFSLLLLSKKELMPDYKCDLCNKTSPETQKIENLKYSPNVIVILFNKYFNKKLIYCPHEFTMPGVDIDIKYKQIGQIRHGGSLHGGHYWALINRGDNWFIADDMSIHLVPYSLSAETYVVFFERF
jgi:ubiquitin C-terminal hydrolase